MLCGRAEAQPVKLPDDGWWIKYYTNVKNETNGEVQKFTGLTTYSLVGTVMENGEKLRWVELHSTSSEWNKRHTVLLKLLVAEKDLIESERPLEKLKRGWSKINDRDIRRLVAGNAGTVQPKSLAIFPGVWQKSELVENPRVIDYQKGRLTILKASTRRESNPAIQRRALAKPSVDTVVKTQHTAWFDLASAPVLTAVKSQSKTFEGDQQLATRDDDMVMVDTGSDARSELPDHN